MKLYLFINPFTFKPYEFSYCETPSFKITLNEKQNDESFTVKELPPIVLEVKKFDLSLLSKTYNPKTGILE